MPIALCRLLEDEGPIGWRGGDQGVCEAVVLDMRAALLVHQQFSVNLPRAIAVSKSTRARRGASRVGVDLALLQQLQVPQVRIMPQE